MVTESKALRCILVSLLFLALTFVAPAAAQGTAPRMVQPGETIAVGDEALVLDLSGLRNASTFNPVTELRHYRDDDPAKQIVRVIGVPNDGYFTINTHTLSGRYGRYFAFSSKDGLIRQHSIVFAPVAAVTATGATQAPETAAGTETGTVPETAAGTSPATPTTVPTQAPVPELIAIAAIGICGLLAAARRG